MEQKLVCMVWQINSLLHGGAAGLQGHDLFMYNKILRGDVLPEALFYSQKHLSSIGSINCRQKQQKLGFMRTADDISFAQAASENLGKTLHSLLQPLTRQPLKIPAGYSQQPQASALPAPIQALLFQPVKVLKELGISKKCAPRVFVFY